MNRDANEKTFKVSHPQFFGWKSGRWSDELAPGFFFCLFCLVSQRMKCWDGTDGGDGGGLLLLWWRAGSLRPLPPLDNERLQGRKTNIRWTKCWRDDRRTGQRERRREAEIHESLTHYLAPLFTYSPLPPPSTWEVWGASAPLILRYVVTCSSGRVRVRLQFYRQVWVVCGLERLQLHLQTFFALRNCKKKKNFRHFGVKTNQEICWSWGMTTTHGLGRAPSECSAKKTPPNPFKCAK